MAEGDTIWRLAERLDVAAAGRTCTASSFRRGRLALVDLGGQVLTEVHSHGKHLLMRFDGGFTLHSHLRMQGRWERSDRPPARWPRSLQARLDFDGVTLLGHDLPVLDIVTRANERRVIGHLGPDLAAPDADLAAATARLGAATDRPIVGALLDQRNLAGLGNLYALEVAFLAGLDPRRRVGTVPDLAGLVTRATELLRRGVLTGVQSTTGRVRRSEQHWVYGRAGRPCRRCARPITFLADAAVPWGRATWWCPACQPPVGVE